MTKRLTKPGFLAVLAVVLVAAGLLFYFLLRPGPGDASKQYVTISAKEAGKETEPKTLLRYNSFNASDVQTLTVKAGNDYHIIVENDGDTPVVFELFASGSGITVNGTSKGKCEGKEETSFVIRAEETGELAYSLQLNFGQESHFLIANQQDFSYMLSQESVRGATVRLLNPISFQQLRIDKPFTLFCDSYVFTVEQELYFQDSTAGHMAVNGSFHAETIFFNTPLWDVDFTQLPNCLAGPQAAFYAHIQSLNGEAFDSSQIQLNSPEQWERLYDSDQFPYLREQCTVYFSGSYVLEGTYEIGKPVSFIFDPSIDVTNVLFFMKSREKASIQIKAECRYQDYFIVFDTPLWDVLWEGSYLFATQDFLETMNIASYNTVQSNRVLGGLGREQILSMKLEEQKHAGIQEDLIYTVSGNVITGYYGYSVKKTAFSNARPKIELSGGSADFLPEFRNGDGTVDLSREAKCRVTDKAGNVRTYLIRTVQKQYELPVVYLSTQDGAPVTSKETYLKGTFSMKAEKDSFAFSVSDRSMQIKGRGNSTWNWAKKPYRIKFDKKISLLGLPKSKDYILLANHADKSLIRNQVAMKLGRVLTNLPYVPRMEPVDVFLNGAYVGVYLLSEKIEVASGRVEIEESTENDTGYLLEVGGAEDGDLEGVHYFHAGTLKYVRIRSPQHEVRTPSQLQYIKQYAEKADKAVTTLTNYEEYIDIPALIDWFLHHELTYNLDSGFRRSCYITKNAGGKLTMGPPWDFDLALGNFSKDNAGYNDWASLGEDNADSYVKVTWMNYLLQDPGFTKQLKSRWKEIGNTLLDAGLKEIDRCAGILEPSQQENFKVWNILGKRVAYESRKTAGLKTYKEQLDYLRQFLKDRKVWMDQTIDSL